MEFVDTPLHMDAKEGCMGYAMEIMNLKPSFARKLKQQGLSPIHLAVKNGHKEMVLRFLEIDKDLVRVREKKGETPLHYKILIEFFQANDGFKFIISIANPMHPSSAVMCSGVSTNTPHGCSQTFIHSRGNDGQQSGITEIDKLWMVN
ncbi:hypothetical protein V6N13_061904 [Hibiscus sabdariffa]|uniref:Uncharacterized protein n=2 Tax=Hibiscus sabdariffa TaxID=183260 RepID=A0ABR2BQY6_9ROSI